MRDLTHCGNFKIFGGFPTKYRTQAQNDTKTYRTFQMEHISRIHGAQVVCCKMRMKHQCSQDFSPYRIQCLEAFLLDIVGFFCQVLTVNFLAKKWLGAERKASLGLQGKVRRRPPTRKPPPVRPPHPLLHFLTGATRRWSLHPPFIDTSMTQEKAKEARTSSFVAQPPPISTPPPAGTAVSAIVNFMVLLFPFLVPIPHPCSTVYPGGPHCVFFFHHAVVQQAAVGARQKASKD